MQSLHTRRGASSSHDEFENDGWKSQVYSEDMHTVVVAARMDGQVTPLVSTTDEPS